MTLNLRMSETAELKPHIAVFGVGGAGGNAVNNMIEKSLEGVDFIVANTDAQALQNSRSTNRIQIGEKVTEGLGAGARPTVGAAAAEESIEAIVDQLVGCHMCFITAGMGGGTGTGAAPIIAQAARELGVLTVGVVTKPFQFEGVKRMRQAEEGVEALQKVVDTLIVIPNQNLFRVANEKTTFVEAFQMADDVLYQGVKGVTDLMVRPGIINLDFADIRSVMDEMGKAMMGTGEADGEDRAIQAAEKAIANPLLDEISLKGSQGVLINVTGGHDLTLFEMDEAANRIREEVDEEANIIVGSTLDTSLEGVMRVSVVATGIDAHLEEEDAPHQRRTLKEPLTQEVSLEQTEKTENSELVSTHINSMIEAEDVSTMGFDPETVQNTNAHESAETDDLPPPAYQPEEQTNSEDFFQAEEVPVVSAAPNAHSEEASVVAHASEKTSADVSALAAPQSERAEKSRGFGLNSLISKMTGSGDSAPPSRAARAEQSHLSTVPNEAHQEDITSSEDQDRIEVPAFLRRQAN